MKRNKLRERLNADQPTVGTRIHTTWPSIVEAVGYTGIFDYVEFLAEYAPFDLYALDNFCRAAELFEMSTMIKVDQEPRGHLAQRGIGAGFQSVLFADCRTVDDAHQCVRIVRPETPEHGGIHGVASRRFAYMGYGGSPEYIRALNDVVVALMIEKKGAVEHLEEILSLGGVDMVQWGPSDYSMSTGMSKSDPKIKAVEKHVIETALKMGVPPRAEINSPEQAKYYLDMGVKHFSLNTEIVILYNWLRENGEELLKVIDRA